MLFGIGPALVTTVSNPFNTPAAPSLLSLPEASSFCITCLRSPIAEVSFGISPIAPVSWLMDFSNSVPLTASDFFRTLAKEVTISFVNNAGSSLARSRAPFTVALALFSTEVKALFILE